MTSVSVLSTPFDSGNRKSAWWAANSIAWRRKAGSLTWVELVATVYWLLWVLREMVEVEKANWPAWWRSRKLTPGAMRRLAAGLFLELGWAAQA